METFSDHLIDSAFTNLTNKPINFQYIEMLVAKMKFLDKDTFGDPQKIFNASKQIR